MLPKHHFDDKCSEVYNDTDWIAAQLDRLPISMQKQVSDKYSDIYLKLTIEKDKKARSRANTWLRRTADKHEVKNKDGYF